jgi:hypothetical protein
MFIIAHHSRTEMQLDMKSFFRLWIFGKILVQHNHDLTHVVQFGHG